jgi:two-component system LytT family response regulator
MPLRIAIIEDEPATARNLKFMLQEIDPTIEVLATLGSVKEATAWLEHKFAFCELIFMDIRLNDGLSLDIFNKVSITAPVIFVTAYNDYALQAFKANGIDYILKPFDEKDLEQALTRFRRLTGHASAAPTSPSTGHATTASIPPQTPITADQLQKLAASLLQPPSWRQSFLVHFRDRLIPLTVEEIAWFYTAEETSYAVTHDNKRYIVDGTLEQLQDQLDPRAFFRVNRQFIIHRKGIAEISFYFNGRLLLKTLPESGEKMLISKARVPEFKAWMNA